jgi:hypothetical protein
MAISPPGNATPRALSNCLRPVDPAGLAGANQLPSSTIAREEKELKIGKKKD